MNQRCDYKLMFKIVIFIKQKCSQCFRESNVEETDDFNQWLIDSRMRQMKPISRHHPTTISNSPSLLSPRSQPPNPTQTTLQRSKSDHIRDQELHQQMFYSIQSKDGKVRPTRDSNQQHQEASIGERVEEESSRTSSLNEGDKDETGECRMQSQGERLAAWMKDEYGGRLRRIQVGTAARGRLKGVQGLLLHKLQDFKIRFLGQSGSPSFSLINKSKSVQGHFQAIMMGSSSSRMAQHQSYYRIQHSILDLPAILRLFASRQFLREVHGLSEVGLYQIDGWQGELPLLGVKQRGRQLHIAWQVTQVATGEEEMVMEMGTSVDQGEGGWQRLLKYHFGKKGVIELYTESLEEAGGRQADFVRGRFNALERLLLKRKVIDK